MAEIVQFSSQPRVQAKREADLEVRAGMLTEQALALRDNEHLSRGEKIHMIAELVDRAREEELARRIRAGETE